MKKYLLFLSLLLCFSIGAKATTFTFTTANDVTQDGITVSFAKGEGQAVPAYNNGLRLYAKNTITITLASDTDNLSEISLKFTKQGSNAYITSLTPSSGSLTSGGTPSSSDETKTDTWTGSAKSVTFTLGDSGQRVIKEIEVIVGSSTTIKETLKASTFTSNTGTSYDTYNWTSDITGISYQAQMAVNNKVNFQFRSTNSTSGLVTTKNPNGYILKSVKISYADCTTTTNVYGDNSDYTSPANLYATSANNNKAKGTLIGNLSATGTLTPTTSYTAFGLRSSSGGLYISSIELTWEKPSTGGTDPVELTKFAYTKTTADWDLNPSVTNPALPTLEILPANANVSVTYKSSDDTVASVGTDGKVKPLAVGTTTITATFAGDKSYKAAEATYTLTVKNTPSTVDPNPEWNASYTIEFKTAVDNNSNVTFSTSSNPTEVLEKGADYVAKFTSSENAYVTGIGGARIGQNKNKGHLNFNLSEKGKVIPTKITCLISGNNAVTMTINGNSYSVSSKFDGSNYVECNIPVNGKPIESFSIEKPDSNIGYIKAITVYYNEPEPELGDIVAKSSDNQEFDEVMEVVVGTTFTFTSDNAEDISVTVDDEPVGKFENGVYTWTVSKPYDTAYVVVTATLGSNKKTFEFLLDATLPTLGEIQGVYGPENAKVEEDKDYVVASGTQFTFSSEGANRIEIEARNYDDSNSEPILLAKSDSSSITWTPEVMKHSWVSVTAWYGDYKEETSKALDFGLLVYDALIPPLGDIVVTVSDGKTVENEGKITVYKGTVFTFKAENATHIELYSEESEFADEVYDDTLTWTADEICEDEYIIVSASSTERGYQENSDFEFYLTVINATPVLPVVKIGDEELENGGSKTIIKGTEVTVTCENASQVKGKINDTPFGPENTPYPLTITEDTELSVWGVNDDVEGEAFTYSFTVGEVDPKMPAVGSNFRQMLNGDTIVEGYYVIARHDGDKTNVAMSRTLNNGNITSINGFSFIDDIPTTVTFNKEDGDVVKDKTFSLITTTSEDVLIVKLVKNDEDQWAIRTVNLGDGLDVSQGYLTGSDGGTALSISQEFVPAYISFSDYCNVDIKFVEGGNRKIVLAANTNWFNYQGSALAIQLYKYTTANLFVPDYDVIELVPQEEAKEIQPKNDSYPEPITYNVKGNTTIIEVVGNKVSAPKEDREGKATIVAMWDESDEWFAGRTEILVVIKRYLENDDFFFRHKLVRGKKDVGVTAQAVYYIGSAPVTYTISRAGESCENEITINSVTGMIRPEDLRDPKLGEENVYTVTASVPNCAEHYAASTSYDIIIEAPEEGEKVAGDATFDFTDTTNPYGFFDGFDSFTTGNGSKWSTYYEHNINGYTDNTESIEHEAVSTLSNNGVNLILDGSYRWFTKNQLRTYDQASLKISAEKAKILSVEFTLNNGASNKIYVDGVKITSQSVKSLTWDANNPQGVSSITFTTGDNVQFNKIKVILLQSGASGSQEAQLSFNDDDRVVNIYAGDLTPLPKLSHNDELTFEKLQFDIDEISEDNKQENSKNYEIFPSKYEDIQVIVNNPGVYTFRAFYEGDDFLNGMAILRLNVFPRLSVLPSEDSDNELAKDERTKAPNLTLVHATYDEENDAETATIALPTLDELNNALKYSTISVSQVEIKHGEKIEVYAVKPSESAPADARRRANENGVAKDISEMPSTFDFIDDGYVKYTLVYANTPDFSIDETVHVVLMPKTPAVITEGEGDKVSNITLTPSYNAHLQYATYFYSTDNVPNPECPYPFTEKKENSKSYVPENNITWESEWKTLEPTEVATIEVPAKEQYGTNDMFGVKYRSVKDLTGIVSEGVDTVLSSVDESFGINKEEILTGVEDLIGDAEDAEVRYFNLQGFEVKNPVKGEIYIRVQGREASKIIAR